MEIKYKRLTNSELDTFIRMRINQLREEGAKEDIIYIDEMDNVFLEWSQMFMIQRAKALAAHNMMQAKGITFEDLQNAVSEASAPSDTMVCVLHLLLKSERKKQ